MGAPQPDGQPVAQDDARRLRWRCRRGMKELDLLLERYLGEQYPTAQPSQQRAFATLLEFPDPVLHAYLVGRARPQEEALLDVLRAITRASGPSA